MTTQTLPQFAPFDAFACVNDSRVVSVGPFLIYAHIEYDTDTKPTDFDCHTPEQIAAWRKDDWFFVGVVLRVYVNNIKLLDHATSLWGVECNLGTDNLHLTDIANELLPEALAEAELVRSQLLASLAVPHEITNR
jgi:hypothetical protein